MSAIVYHSHEIKKVYFTETYSQTVLDFTQEVKYFDRLDWNKTLNWFNHILNDVKNNYIKECDLNVAIVLERPMINPERFKQSIIAVRAFEALIIVLEILHFEYTVIDSKKWQHHFFGKNTALLDLKKESLNKALSTLEEMKEQDDDLNEIKLQMKKHGDADAFLIALYSLTQVK